MQYAGLCARVYGRIECLPTLFRLLQMNCLFKNSFITKTVECWSFGWISEKVLWELISTKCQPWPGLPAITTRNMNFRLRLLTLDQTISRFLFLADTVAHSWLRKRHIGPTPHDTALCYSPSPLWTWCFSHSVKLGNPRHGHPTARYKRCWMVKYFNTQFPFHLKKSKSLKRLRNHQNVWYQWHPSSPYNSVLLWSVRWWRRQYYPYSWRTVSPTFIQWCTKWLMRLALAFVKYPLVH